jgi:filamentous hemagglutinin family protein
MRKLFLLATCFISANPIVSNASPQGGQVTSGQALIHSTEALTTINQSTPNAIIDWQSFNIGENETVNFIQPDTNSTTLNRINNHNPSEILGSIQSNGRVFLSNPNGFIFSNSSTINTSSFLVTTSEVTSFNEDHVTLNDHGTEGYIINNGTLSSLDSGFIALFAPKITNSGSIINPNGEIILTNKTQGTVFLNDMAGIGIALDSLESINPIGIDNSGNLLASGGRILLDSDALDSTLRNAINNSGLISASSIEENGGSIRLTSSSGSISQSGVIQADAINAGNGGDIRVIANDSLVSQGSISAQGGLLSGDGGFIETSGYENIELNTNVYTNAKNGQAGHWLIDPDNIVIGDVVGADLSSSQIITSLNNNGILSVLADIEINVNGGLNTASQAGELNLIAPTININSSIIGTDLVLNIGSATETSNSVSILADMSVLGLDVNSSATTLAANITSFGEVIFSSNQSLTIDGIQSITTSGSNKISLNTVKVKSNDGAASNNDDQLTLNTVNGIVDLRNMTMSSTDRLESFIINRTTSNTGSNGDINISGDIYADVFSILNTNDTLGSEQLIQLATDTNIYSDISTTLTHSKINGNSSNLSITGKDITLDAIDDIASFTVNQSSALLSSETTSLTLTDNISTKGAGIEVNLSQGEIHIGNDISLVASNTGHILLNADITSNSSSNLSLSVADSDLQIQGVNSLGNLSIENASSLTSLNGDIDIQGTFTTGTTPSMTFVGDRVINANNGIDFSTTKILSDTNTSTISLAAFDPTSNTLAGISISDVTVDSLNIVSSELILNGDITTSLTSSNSLDLSRSGTIILATDSTLIGNLNLNNAGAIVPINSQSLTNTRNLSVQLGNTDFDLGLVGYDVPLQSLSVTGNGNLTLSTASTLDGTLPIPITDGTSGISFLGDLTLVLGQDLIIDTSSNNGDINLSGLSIDGTFGINLKSGAGNISLSNIGLTTPIASIITDTTGIINLHGNIINTDLIFDFSKASSVLLNENVTLGTSDAYLSSLDFGNNTIDGNYDLTLYTNSLSWGAIGQDIALQNISIYSTELALSISENINLAGNLSLELASLELSSKVLTTGGNISVSAANSITMSPTSQLSSADGDINLASQAGDINLGLLEAQSQISIITTIGNITNNIDDYQSTDDTSINLNGESISLTSGSAIGSSAASPVVITAGLGNIELTAGGSIYIANIDNSSISSNKDIIDNTKQSIIATNDSLQQLNRFNFYPTTQEHQDVLDPSWQKEEGNQGTSTSVPRIYYSKKGWRLGNPL